MTGAGCAKRPTLAVRRQEMASFLTSSMVGSRCVLYFARGCHLSYCAWRFFPARHRIGHNICQQLHQSVIGKDMIGYVTILFSTPLIGKYSSLLPKAS